MGNASGTYTQKATISSQLFPFSKWDQKEIHQLLLRGQSDLSESFGLRKHEVEYLIGINEEISFNLLRSLFDDIFDTDHNNLVDKMELMCVICMVSKLSTSDKLEFFFDLFNFNNKGFLNDSELTLLFMAVTRGVFKVDQKFHPPSAKVIKELVKEAFTFAISEPGNLRKPELLRFAVNNPSVYAYLECWRGHASQVLLLEGTKWRDLSFPCDESAITWNYSWGILGLPPASFVHWRRIDHIGTEIVTSHLFAHELTFLKTIDRKKVYKGDGILGKGFFKRGCLADLWLLNGLSALVANPELVFACFGETGQEESGRYCCRIYEGGSWRSIYVDDRIPCNTFLSPIFTTSSCKYEYWPLILQKAWAKYLGSYGHIAWCSDRNDASLISLRMLTGGHVKRFYIFHYDWKSIIVESIYKESGTKFIIESLKKGHVISFLRSATQSMMNLSLKQNKSTINLLPVGHFFPLLGYITNQAGYIYFIFKDTWGLVSDVNQDVNLDTGRCNTFKIKVEDITMFFDCFVISFYPDSLRSKTSKLGIKPWITEASAVISDSNSNNNIAKYVLKVRKKPIEEKVQSGDNRFKDKHQIINEAIIDANAVPRPEEAIHVPRLKDRANFTRSSDRPMPGAASSKPETSKTPQIASTNVDNVDELDDVINLAFTASSAIDWSYAGSHEAKPTIKVRIIPSQETKQFIRQREAELIQRKKLKQEYLKKRRLAQAQLLDLNDTTLTELEENNEGNSLLSTSEQNSVNGSLTAGGNNNNHDLGEDSSSLLYHNPSISSEDKQYELYFSQERSWLSQNIQLIEGEYLILVDLQFQQSLKEIRQRSLPRDISETPWLDYRLCKLLQHEKIVEQLNTEKFIGKLYEQDDDARSLQSLKEFEKRLFSDKQRDGVNIAESSPSAIPAVTEDILPADLEALMENKIWLECSSNDMLKLRPYDSKRKKDKSKFEVSEPVFPVSSVQKETWPLTCESQLEIASIKLTEMMTEMRFEAQVLAEEFISIARKYKEEKKIEAMNQAGRGKSGINSNSKGSSNNFKRDYNV